MLAYVHLRWESRLEECRLVRQCLHHDCELALEWVFVPVYVWLVRLDLWWVYKLVKCKLARAFAPASRWAECRSARWWWCELNALQSPRSIR